MNKEKKRVLIIIVNYNGAGYLGDCLLSLTEINYSKDNFEILIVDNASTDGSVEYLKKNWVEIKLIKNLENLGFAAGNNIGFQSALQNNFDYAYILNQDTVVQPNFLAEAINIAETNPRIGAVQSKLLLYYNIGKINSIGNEIHYLGFAFAGGYLSPDRELAVREIAYPSGASTLFKTSVLEEAGLFNPDFFMYHEDVDLGWRIWLRGYQVVLAPKSVVYHKYEFSRSIKKYYFMERNRYLVLLQNYKLATLLLISPPLIIMGLSMFFYSFFAGFWREELRVCRYFLNSRNWQQIIKTRKKIQKNRHLGDAAVIKRFVGKIEFQDLSNPLLRYIANPILNLYWQIVKKIIWW